ncbi:MAG: type III-A CRISPR-associated protein Cas10/Csm1 [Candidatus Aminicenantes bacterium]|nr:type III-A CRISPR-associated protein Cas10/Csm1 [Candidatus Aminicenantes bacterium]
MSNFNREYQAIILASLLHDIGKFSQRAGYSFDLKAQLDEYDYYNFCRRTGEGTQVRYSHQHGAYTAKFFRTYLPNYDDVGVLAALHHVPDNANNDRQRFLAKLISTADRMSSGERTERDENEESRSPHEEPMLSIFSRLDSDELKNKNTDEFYVPLVALEETLESIFPVAEKKKAFSRGSGRESYRLLWDQFIDELSRLKKDDMLIPIYYLLNKYTLTIPAAVYKDKPDISLFHHSKSTAAIASCLFLLSNDQLRSVQLDEEYLNNILAEIKVIEKTSPVDKFNYINRQDFILLGGDISGIQDFIYQVTSEKALKGLRARSFYLQLISEMIAKKVLRDFDLTEVNLLYSGGGNFYLLLPMLTRAEDKIRAIQKEIEAVMLTAHNGKLSAVLSWLPVSYYDFFVDFARLWKEIGKQLAIAKRKKFSSLLSPGEQTEYRERIFGPYDEGGEKKGCLICGEELDIQSEYCSFCDSLIQLSNELKKAEAIIIYPINEPQNKDWSERPSTWWQVAERLGYKYKLLGNEGASKYQKNSLIINSVNFVGRADGFLFVARKTNSSGENEPLTLENMAEAASGIKKWGVLRADVDRLGELFQERLGENKTISRVSMLSSMLSLYFTARMSQLEKWVEQKRVSPGLADYVYTAYSGGDDLFLLGPWSVLCELAKVIRDDFDKFTCGRLTISAGIYYAPSKKYPVYQAARMAGETEESAKNAGRNRINIFGESIPWEYLPRVQEIVDLLVSLITGKNGKTVPRSLLSVLYSIYREKELKNAGKIKMERVWRLHYALKRMMVRMGQDKQVELKKLLELILINYEIYPYLNIATRVADYLTRK